MGRNKVRMHHRTTDAQAVWKEYSEYMTTASWQVMVVNPNPQNNCEDQDPTDTPSTVPTTFQASSDHTLNPKCAHNPLATQCNQSQYPNLNHNFALPQFMAEHNYEDLDPTDSASTVPTAFQASSDHTSNPKCSHDPMATQCNQSQYITLMKQICAHNPSASQLVKPTSPTTWLPHTHQILGSMF